MRQVIEASEENDSWHLISKNASRCKDSKIDIQTYNRLKFPSSLSAKPNRARFSEIAIQDENLDFISPDMTVQCQSSNNVAKINPNLKNALKAEKDSNSSSSDGEEAKNH